MDRFVKTLEIADGVTEVAITHHELGWWPEQLGNHQIVASGLDSGTYAVAIRYPGQSGTVTKTSGVANGAPVLVDTGVAAAFKVTFSDLGETAAPKIVVTGWPRRNG